jgi:hypothetical protein
MRSVDRPSASPAPVGLSLVAAAALYVEQGWPTAAYPDHRNALACPRCGALPVETHDLPNGDVEAFCTACTEAPRYFGYVIKADGCGMERPL